MQDIAFGGETLDLERGDSTGHEGSESKRKTLAFVERTYFCKERER